MITITKLISVLFAVISIINQSPSLSPTEKANMVDQIIVAIGQSNETPVATSTALIGGDIQKISSVPTPIAGQLAQLSIGPDNADGSRTVSSVLNGAASLRFTIRFGIQGKSDPVAAGGSSASGQSLANLYSEGEYLWQVVSYDANGTPMGTTTGQFIIND